MKEILTSQIWQFVGVILALLAIAVSLFVYYKQKQRKALSYQIISLTPLLSVTDEIKERVEILFDKQPVEQVHLLIIKFVNSGNLPITRSDYDEPIKISMGEKVKVLSHEVIETNPEGLPANTTAEDREITFDKILLNAGDSMTAKILLSDYEHLSVKGRIQAVKEIKDVTIQEAEISQKKVFWFGGTVLGGIAFTQAALFSIYFSDWIPVTIVALIILAVFLMGISARQSGK